jgi:Siphovirus-type tail component, C-terminal domain
MTTWTDPQGNQWSTQGNVVWVPGALQFPGTLVDSVIGPAGMDTKLAAGVDIRMKLWPSPDNITMYPFNLGPWPGGIWGFIVGAGNYVNLQVSPDSGTTANNGPTPAHPTPDVNGYVVLRFVYDGTAGAFTYYQSNDDGLTWTSFANSAAPAIAISAPNQTLGISNIANGYKGQIAWIELHSFDGTLLANVDFRRQWGLPPSVTAISPPTGRAWVTHRLTISGYGLSQATGVSFNGFLGTDFSISPGTDGTISITTPIFGVESVDVEVITPNGNIPAGTYQFTALPPPDPEPPGPGGVPMHQGRCLVLANIDDSTLQLSNILDLMDYDANGIIVDTVDLGYPDVREDTGVWTDANGTWDFTQFFGSRGITLSGTLVDSDRGTRSKAYNALVPFLNPAARPVLVYSFDADETTAYLRLRSEGYSGAITNPVITKWSAQWKCPDGLAYDATAKSVTIIPGITGSFGRVYTDPQVGGTVTPTSAWKPNRFYPTMGGAAYGLAVNDGSAPSWPIIQIFGACTVPAIINDTTGLTFAMASGYTINPGEILVIDTRQRAVYLGTPDASRYNQVDFSRSTFWPLVPGENHITFVPVTADNNARAVINWQDAYI